jgi:hypothetical protein
MNDEQPIEPEKVPSFAESAEPKRTQIKDKFLRIPPEIVEEMKERFGKNEPVKAVMLDMQKKYPNVEELKATYASWQKWARNLKGITPEVKEGIVVKKELVSSLPSAEDLQNVVKTVINPQISLDRKQEALASLFDKATARLAILEARQRNFIDPDIEALMIAYMKEQKSLIEKVTELQEVLNKDVIGQFRSELNEYTRVILTTVYASYRLEHPDADPTSKFDGFKATLEQHLTQTLQAYNQNTPKN